MAVGQVTSAAWAQTTGACVALAYVWRRDDEPVTNDYLTGGVFDIDIGGHLRRATLQLKPPVDPASTRTKQ